jgi:hypothetical protein
MAYHEQHCKTGFPQSAGCKQRVAQQHQSLRSHLTTPTVEHRPWAIYEVMRHLYR